MEARRLSRPAAHSISHKPPSFSRFHFDFAHTTSGVSDCRILHFDASLLLRSRLLSIYDKAVEFFFFVLNVAAAGKCLSRWQLR